MINGELLLTTVPGLEDICLEEVKELIDVSSYSLKPLRGRLTVRLRGDLIDALEELCLKARSVERVFVIVAKGRLKGTLRRSLEEIMGSYPHQLLPSPYLPFSVRTSRVGDHNFTSLEVSKELGEIIMNITSEINGVRPLVSLDNPFVNFFADVVGDEVTICLDVTGLKGLHDREYRAYYHPASLNPIIAYAMARLTKVKGAKRLLDPMCGSGTLAIEAGLYGGIEELYCMDVNPAYLEGAEENLRRAGLLDKAKLILGDALKLEKHFEPRTFDRVLVNPPYGIRVGGKLKLKDLYEGLFKALNKVITDDCLIGVITPLRKLLMKASSKVGYEIISERKIVQGGMNSYIFVLRKRGLTA